MSELDLPTSVEWIGRLRIKKSKGSIWKGKTSLMLFNASNRTPFSYAQHFSITIILDHASKHRTIPPLGFLALRDPISSTTALLSIFALLLHLYLLPHGGIDSELEDFVDAGHLLATAFHVRGTHLPCYVLALFLSDGSQALGLEELDACALVAEIGLETDEDEWSRGTEMEDFGIPLDLLLLTALFWQYCFLETYLVHDVFERIGAVDGKANEEEVGLGIRERTETIVFFLSRCIPQC